VPRVIAAHQPKLLTEKYNLGGGWKFHVWFQTSPKIHRNPRSTTARAGDRAPPSWVQISR
jgi:hypothetical protein